MSDITPKNSLSLHEQLEQEKQDHIASIDDKNLKIRHMKALIKWEKKRLQLVTDQLTELLEK